MHVRVCMFGMEKLTICRNDSTRYHRYQRTTPHQELRFKDNQVHNIGPSISDIIYSVELLGPVVSIHDDDKTMLKLKF